MTARATIFGTDPDVIASTAPTEDLIERGAMALARYTFYGPRHFDMPLAWPPSYPDTARQAARNKVRAILQAIQC